MHHPIQVASRRSGVSPHLIRIWERRYGALSPCRSQTNRRQYSEDDIRRLAALRELIERGHRISGIASLCCDELHSLLGKERELAALALPRPATPPSPADCVTACLEAVKTYDGDGARCILQRARLDFGMRCVLRQVIAPLIAAVGHGWQEGEVRIGHEHLCTVVIQEFLLAPVPGSRAAASAPEVVVATPPGEAHDLGAMLAASAARDLGWRVTYLGANLRADEITACALARKARAVALSVVYPDGDPDVAFQLRKLRGLLPASTAIVIGGRAARSYETQMDDLELLWAHTLPDFDMLLGTLGNGHA